MWKSSLWSCYFYCLYFPWVKLWIQQSFFHSFWLSNSHFVVLRQPPFSLMQLLGRINLIIWKTNSNVKVNGNTRSMCEIWSKLAIKAEWRLQCVILMSLLSSLNRFLTHCSSIFIFDFETLISAEVQIVANNIFNILGTTSKLAFSKLFYPPLTEVKVFCVKNRCSQILSQDW